MGTEEGVQDGDVLAMGVLGPETTDVVDVFLFVDVFDLLVGHLPLILRHEVDAGVLADARLGQSLHDLFHSLGSFGVVPLGTVLEHAGVVYDPCLFEIHSDKYNG